MVGSGQDSQWLRAFIATILVLGVMKVAQPVTLPLALAMFLIVLAWPLQVRLEKRLPSWLAFISTFMIFLMILALFVGVLALTGNIIARKAPQYIAQIEFSLGSLGKWLGSQGFSISNESNSLNQAAQQALKFIGKGFQGLYSMVSLLGLVLVILLFGLLEVRRFRDKLEQHFGEDVCERVVNSFSTIAEQYQRYIVVKSFVSIVTGFLVGLFCWLMGLELAFVWGIAAFLLNYIPSLGSIISTLVITLFGILQFQNAGQTLLLFAGITGIQLFFGNWLDPRLQGKVLSLSPLVIVLSVIFWGWIWGVLGALLGVPLTIGVVIAFDQFERTRWITTVLAKVQE